MADARPAASLANLKAGDLTGFEKDERGRITTSRSEIGRQHALDILSDPMYRAGLKARMVAGEGGAIEVWLWRIGYGDPPKPREDSGDDEARWIRARERLRAFMKENTEDARAMAELVARGMPLLPPGPPDADPTPVG